LRRDTRPAAKRPAPINRTEAGSGIAEVAVNVAEYELVKPPLVFTAARIPVMVPGLVFWVENENGAADEPLAAVPV